MSTVREESSGSVIFKHTSIDCGQTSIVPTIERRRAAFFIQKLDMDFEGHSGLGMTMTDGEIEQLRTICAQIGSIMEDTSVVSLVWRKDDGLSHLDRLKRLQNAHAEIGYLLAEATRLLLDR